MSKIILDLCGGTGAWSKPYSEAGYDVRLITLPEYDVRLHSPPDNVYGIFAAPPCTEFSRAKHFHGKGKYNHDFIKGLEIVSACMRIILTSNPVFWALENPLGYLVNYLEKPKYTFDAWEFGHNYQKRTALWGEFKHPMPTVQNKSDKLFKFSMLKSKDIAPEFYGVLDRQARRAITPSGFAQAFFEVNKL
jgi:hypothetical protein